MSIHDKIISAFGMLRDIIAGKAEKSDIAPEFSTSSTYGEGALVMKDGTLYRCTSLHSGTWDASHFSATTVDGALAMIPQSDKAAEETNADVRDVIDAEYTVVANAGDAVEVHVAAEDPYAAAEEMSPSNVSTASLKGDVNLCGASVVDFTTLEDLSYLFAGSLVSDVILKDGFARSANKQVGMFLGCPSLTGVSGPANNSAADMSMMFYGCEKLTYVSLGTTSNSISISYDSDISNMFNLCTSLKEIEIVVSGGGEHTKPVGELFGMCSGLERISLLGFGSAATFDAYKSMLSGAVNLKEINLHNSFNYVHIFTESYLDGSLTTRSRGPFTELVGGVFTVVDSFNRLTGLCQSYNDQEHRFEFNDFGRPEHFNAENSFAELPFEKDIVRSCKSITLVNSFSKVYSDNAYLGSNILNSVYIKCNFLRGGADAIFAKDYDNSFGGPTDRSSLRSVTLSFPDKDEQDDGAESQDGYPSIAAGFYMCNGMTYCDIESSELGLVGDLAGYYGKKSDPLGCFQGCESLTSLYLPDGFGKGSVDSSSCFAGCSSLEVLWAKSVGSNVKAMDPAVKCSLYNCFYGCTKLRALTVCDEFGTAEGVNLEGCFVLCEGFKSVSYDGDPNANMDSVLLPIGFGSSAASVKACFESCHNLTYLSLPGGFGSQATDIRYCFSDCTSLVTLALPDDFGSKAEYSGNFIRCFALENITGAIKSPVSFGFGDSENLTEYSLKNILNGLVTVTSQTLTLSSTSKGKLTQAQISAASAKGWTIA